MMILDYSSIREKGLLVVFFFISLSVCSQSEITFNLPSEGYGTLTIDKIVDDSIAFQYKKSFWGKKIKAHLEFPPSELEAGVILKYMLELNDGSSYSYVCLGSPDKIEITLPNFSVEYKETHPMYLLSKYQDFYNENKSYLDSINRELVNLYDKNIFPNFIHFAIFQSIKSGLFDIKSVPDRIKHDNSNWLRKIDQEGVEQNSFDKKLQNVLSGVPQEETVILKFGASWCAPCLKDDELIQQLINDDKLPNKIIYIYTDLEEKQAAIPYYATIHDPKGYILSSHGVESLPTYIVISNNNTVSKQYHSIKDINFDIKSH